MSCRLHALCFDARDPGRLADFWGGLLGWPRVDDHGSPALAPTDDTGFRLRFVASDEPKTLQNLVHPDLTSSSLDDQAAVVARALELGGRHCDVGQDPDDDHVVLADPEGNELCVIEPWNSFLADCGRVGALAGDGTQAVGYFWSAALGWPLVWDQDEETAIRSPHGGPKVTWGGPPLMPRPARVRQHFDLAVDDGDPASEVERLVALGARVLDPDGGDTGGWLLADPDGNPFCLSA